MLWVTYGSVFCLCLFGSLMGVTITLVLMFLVFQMTIYFDNLSFSCISLFVVVLTFLWHNQALSKPIAGDQSYTF